jgi:hypothetical protein
MSSPPRNRLPPRPAGLWLLALLPAAAATAATYYVRPDGGSAEQCTGLADAPYPGSGRARACAWSHPFVALPPSAPERPVAARIRGGDTLIVGSGSYMMGYGAAGAAEMAACYASFTPDCRMQPVPAGPDPAHRTRVLGQGWDAGCARPPQLWGTRAVHRVLDLTRSSNVEVGCLEITDHSSCIVNHCIGGHCAGEVDRCTDGADARHAQNGLWSTDAADVYLHDLDIHGIAGAGVHAGRMTDWRVERVRIRANGFAGWDADVSNGGVESASNAGTLRFSHLEIAWNGCGERYPGGEVFGCWGQEEGGYGDGFGTGKSAGHWVFEDSHVHHNTQDGLDLLHAGEGTVELRRVRAEANAGNQLKAAGAVRIEDAQVVGSCAALRGVGNLGEGDLCRADGAAIALALEDGKRSVVERSTISGQGGCLVVGSGGGESAVLALRGNTLTGGPRWDDPGRLTCGYYLYESRGRVEASGNRISNVKISTEADPCAGRDAASLVGRACEKLKSAYRALQGAEGRP